MDRHKYNLGVPSWSQTENTCSDLVMRLRYAWCPLRQNQSRVILLPRFGYGCSSTIHVLQAMIRVENNCYLAPQARPHMKCGLVVPAKGKADQGREETKTQLPKVRAICLMTCLRVELDFIAVPS
mmetsp:Transcript_15070/g.30601  ORF Transcript_15070/g.30601 Transcript_15070/m.30601 type:complete len:125 (-) Transcript_15070:2559-2933(-)